jgi:acyl-CoA synthetase (AMP-forming)/AMP-acid ligase II
MTPPSKSSAPRTLPDLLQGGDPAQPAIVVPGGPTLTYEQLADRVENLAGRLHKAGVEPGALVSMVLGNNIAFVETFLALTRVGAQAGPLNPAYTTDEFVSFIEDARASVAILDPETGAAWEATRSLGVPSLGVTTGDAGVRLERDGVLVPENGGVEQPDPGSTALFLHTSGTTSRPKGVPLTHANIVASAQNTVRTYDLGPEDASMTVMPLFHVHGLIGVVLSTLASGGRIVLPPRFSASTFWPQAQGEGATWYSGSPTIHQILLARADDDQAPRGAFRFIRSCSAALSPSVLEQVEARFEAPLVEAYGMTEGAHQIASNPLPPGERRASSVGLQTGVEVAVMDERGVLLPATTNGEVVIRGPNVTHGYRDNPEANASSFSDGWFRTGDQGFIADDGYVSLTGRIKEIINRGGEKIAPLEVDAALMRHGAVAEAITFGVPDAKYGEDIHAAVVLRSEVSPDELQRFAAEHLAAFKVPKVIHLVDELPRTATGKVQRRHVAAKFADA